MKNEQEINFETLTKSIKSNKNGFDIIINLNEESESLFVHIQAINPFSLDCYQLRVNQEFIQNHEVLFYFFDNPRELMHHLAKTFEDATISESGELSMNIVVGDVIRKHKTIKIQLLKKELDKEALLSLEIKCLRQEFGSYKLQSQNKIQELKKINSELKESMQRILATFMQKTKRRSKRPSSTRGIETLIQSIKKRQKIQMLCSHLDNPDKIGFREYVVQEGVKIVHVRQGWDCYISRYPIKKNVSFRFKDIKLTDKSFNVGLGTKEAFARCEFQQEYIIIYDFQGQNLTIDGDSHKVPFILGENSQITLTFDEKQRKMAWSSHNKTIAEALVPERMQERQLFLIIQVFDNQDEFFLALA